MAWTCKDCCEDTLAFDVLPIEEEDCEICGNHKPCVDIELQELKDYISY